jgi:hypothetical protein
VSRAPRYDVAIIGRRHRRPGGERAKREWTAAPPPAIRRWPLRFETVTQHVDRAALDARLFDHASALGTAFIWERVTSVDVIGERLTGCSTAGGRRVEASWYIDASGTARVLSRAMGMAGFGLLFAGARAWIGGWTLLARAALWCRGLHGER